MTLSPKQTKIWNYIQESVWITIGLLMYAAAWNLFVIPHGFVGGGLGGLCAEFQYLTGFPISWSYLLVNVVLCGIALIIMGKEFSIKTVFGILGLSLFLWLIPQDFAPLPDDKLLSAIMGGTLAGAGVATYLLRGASTGGSDIIVMIVSKYKNVTWGRVYLMFDACVISSSYFLPQSTIATVAYGFVFMGVQAYVVDLVSNGRRQSVQMFIFTSKYREIADQIIHQHHRGVTLFESIGWYTKKHRKTIYLVTRKRESQNIYKTVKAIDEHAFIAVSNVMSVFGIGFDPIKAGFSKPVLKDANGNVIPPDSEAYKAILSIHDDKKLDNTKPALIHDPVMGDIVPQPPNAPNEVPPDDDIMQDEHNALKSAHEAPQHDAEWPASDVFDIPEKL